MAQTTWKQVVLDTADAYREANGTLDKIPVGSLADKVREGAGVPYTGNNPLTIGTNGYSFDPKTLLKDGLTIVNGVEGEDLTATEADMALAIAELQRMVARKVSDHKGEGEYVWKKDNSIIFDPVNTVDGTKYIITVTNPKFDISKATMDTFVGGSWSVHLTGNTALTGTLGIVKQSGDYVLQWNGAGGIGGGVYDSTKGTITFTNDGSFGQTTATSKFVKNGEVDYVVSDDPTAYPDGGEQDGYWYELISNPVDLADEPNWIESNIREGISMFGKIGTMSEGVSGVEIQKVTPSSDVASLTISHSLGKTPTKFLIVSDSYLTAVSGHIIFCAYPYYKPGSTEPIVGMLYINNYGTNGTVDGSNTRPSLTSSKVTVNFTTGNVKFQKGMTYTVILVV